MSTIKLIFKSVDLTYCSVKENKELLRDLPFLHSVKSSNHQFHDHVSCEQVLTKKSIMYTWNKIKFGMTPNNEYCFKQAFLQ